MSFDKQIKDKFSGFEPEVPEAQIDAGWEKISYFLPQEEKKKRVFFFYRFPKGAGIAAVTAAIFAMGFLLMKMQKFGMPNTLSALQRVIPAPRVIDFKSTKMRQGISAQHPGKNSNQEAVQLSVPVFGVIQTYKKTVVVRHETGSSSAAWANTFRPVPEESSENTVLTKETGTFISNRTDKETLASVYKAQDGTNQELMLLLKRPSLDQEVLSEPDPQLSLFNIAPIDPARSNKMRPTLELFSGFSNRSLLLQLEKDKEAVRAKGFSAGLAAIFPVKPRFYVSGQFIFNYNPLQYHQETTANRIIKKMIDPNTITSVNNSTDTLVYYVPQKSTFELKSGTVWNLSGGAGYQLLNRGQISLEGALFLNLTWMRFNYSISKVISDTGIFVNNVYTPNAASFYALADKTPGPEPVSGKKQVLIFGLNPCLSLIYQLNNRMGLTFRPAYMIQLLPNALEVNQKSYKLRETNWQITLGLRYRL